MVGDGHVEEVELGRLHHAALGHTRKSGQIEPEHGFLQNGKILLGRLGRHAAILRNVGVVHNLGVAQGRHLQKTHKRIELPHNSLLNNLLLQIVANVGADALRCVGRQVVPGQHAAVQGAIQVEVGNLGAHQRKQRLAQGTTAQQVCAATAQFAGAGAAQHKAQPAILDEPVHLVEQGRHFLHLVDDDKASWFEQFALLA